MAPKLTTAIIIAILAMPCHAMCPNVLIATRDGDGPFMPMGNGSIGDGYDWTQSNLQTWCTGEDLGQSSVQDEDGVSACLRTSCYSVNEGYGFYTSCDECAEGYEHRLRIDEVKAYGCAIEYYVCEKVCKNTECKGDDLSHDWAPYETGRESRVIYTCNCQAEWEISTNYRCAAGYYGDGYTCTKCPNDAVSGLTKYGKTSYDGVPDGIGVADGNCTSEPVATTSVAGTKSMGGCYIPDGIYCNSVGVIEIKNNLKGNPPNTCMIGK